MWPTGAVTEDNYVDLVWHEPEFREGYSFAYVVRHHDGRYLGCCYLYPMGRRVALTDELMRHDVDVSWWVTSEAYESGYYGSSTRRLRSGSSPSSRSATRTSPTASCPNRAVAGSRRSWSPRTACVHVIDAAKMLAIDSFSVASKSLSLCWTERPSVSAREKLAITPWLRTRRALASSRL